MSDYPALIVLISQALVTSLIVAVPLLVATLGWGLFASASDALLALAAYLMFAVVCFLGFAVFEGAWAASLFGPLASVRMPIIGALIMTIGMGWQQLSSPGGRARLRSGNYWGFGAAVLAGIFWGAMWRLAGWCLELIGMVQHG